VVAAPALALHNLQSALRRPTQRRADGVGGRGTSQQLMRGVSLRVAQRVELGLEPLGLLGVLGLDQCVLVLMLRGARLTVLRVRVA